MMVYKLILPLSKKYASPPMLLNGKIVHGMEMKFAVAFFIGDTEQHNKLCGHTHPSQQQTIASHIKRPDFPLARKKATTGVVEVITTHW